MYEFDTLVTFLNAVAKLQGIKESEHDWLSSLNGQGSEYPALIYFVDDVQEEEPEGWDRYRLRMALKEINNNGNGGELTVQQKPGKWKDIRKRFDDFFNSLPEYSEGAVYVITKPVYKPDELSQGNDMLIWLNADVSLRVLNCGTPGPIPEIV